jgi:RimJ/RimL family protein N-acetyltransferase
MHIETPIMLQGNAVMLQPLDERHAEDLFQAAQDPDIWRYMPVPAPVRSEDMRRIIASALRLAAGGGELPFAIVERAGGKAIGSTRYMDIQPENRGLEIGWTWLGRAYWRTAINTECKYLLLWHAFETLGAIRVQLKTDLRNERSQQAIARLGALREGVLREHRILHDGYRRSSVYFSILEQEWPAVRARLEAFLARSTPATAG